MSKFWGAFLALGCLSSATASAQQIIPPLKKEFLDSTFAVLPSEVGARYRRETEHLDSVQSVIRTYGLNGKLLNTGEYELRRNKDNISNGTYESWFGNGQLSHHEEFEHGNRVGEMRIYYRNGQLRRRSHYTANMESTGECFLEDGQPAPYFEYEHMPVYPEGDGGNHVIVMAIQRGVKYPKDALRARQGGKVFVSFSIDAHGDVVNTRIVKGVFPSIDAAVVKAVQQLKRFTPGQQDGKPVTVSFTVPITFTIN